MTSFDAPGAPCYNPKVLPVRVGRFVMWLQVKNWVKGVVILAVVGLCIYLVVPIQQKI